MVEIMDLFKLLLATANTTNYYIAGYVVFFLVMTLYLASLVIRYRNLKQEFDLLNDLSSEMEQEA